MFSLGGIQPQLSQSLLPLAQVASAVSYVRTLGQNLRFSRHLSHGQSGSAASTPERDTELNELLHKTSVALEQLGMEDLPRNLTLEDLSPLLSCSNCTSLQNPSRPAHWSESHSSAPSFFENKYGFSEKQLHSQAVGLLQQTQHWVQNPMFQQIRGFKTKRTRSSVGVGSKYKEEQTTDLRNILGSVYGRVSGKDKAKQSEKLKSIVHEFDHSPEVQDKIKVAFAEGYSANERGTGDQMAGWPKRAMRIVWYLLLLWLLVQILQGYSAIGGNMKINVLKGERYEVNPEEISITFNDVKGVDEAKQELKDVVEFLQDPEKFKALGAKLPKGVLLVGPPGIGKTLLARAVAGEAGVPFFHASGSEFDEIFVGTGAKRVRQLFDAAKVRAPCVIFIDEIDTVGAKRTSSQIHPYANQTINQLLSEMDGFQQNEGVIVLGATNRRDNLDQALLRPGRFDVEVRVFPPDLKGRKDILNLYLKRITKGPDIDVEAVARGTTGCTGADLENMVNQAALKAAMDGAPHVTMAHMEFARDKVLMGPAKKTKIADEETNLMTAYHEAGHTLVAFYTKDSTPLHKVTIVPRGMSLGHTSFIPEKEQYNHSRSQLLAQMDVAMGGRVAEELIYGMDKVTTGASSDFGNATGIATAMVKKFGMSEKVGVRTFDDEAFDSGLSMLKVNELSPGTTELIDSEIKRLLAESYERAKTILRTHSAEHRALAQALMKYETLDADDIKLILEGKKLTKKL